MSVFRGAGVISEAEWEEFASSVAYNYQSISFIENGNDDKPPSSSRSQLISTGHYSFFRRAVFSTYY